MNIYSFTNILFNAIKLYLKNIFIKNNFTEGGEIQL